MSEKCMQSLILPGRGIRSHKSHGSLWKAESVEESEEANQRDAERIHSQRASAQHSGNVDLEEIAGGRGKQCTQKKYG